MMTRDFQTALTTDYLYQNEMSDPVRNCKHYTKDIQFLRIEISLTVEPIEDSK